MKTEAVIFDWAGTTIDYGSFAPVQAFIEAFRAFGLQPTVEEIRKPMGMLKRDHIKTILEMPRIKDEWIKVHGKVWTEVEVDQVYQESETSIMKILHLFAEPKPYVLETIEALRNKGIGIGSTTGYTKEMMEIVVPKAKELGYSPDCYITPTECENKGRPYPYMIFENLKRLGVSSVENVIKVGDTVSDIREGKHAGLISVGIIEGSSVLGLSKNEYEGLLEEEKEQEIKRVKAIYEAAGADYVIKDIREVVELVKA